MTLSRFIQAFGHAFRGISSFVKQEYNAKVHLFCTIIVLILSGFASLSAVEWLFVCSAIAGVWVSEMINTAIEGLCDLHTKEFHPSIKKIKDIAAGAVLLASFYAIVVAFLILIPKYL